MSHFGIRLRKLRKANNFSIEGLANKINKIYETKMSKSMISRYENGQADPKMESVRILADFFDVSVDYIIGESLKAKLDEILEKKGMTYEELADKTKLKTDYINSLDQIVPEHWDYQAVKKIATALELDESVLIKALTLQEPPIYNGPLTTKTAAEDFAEPITKYEPETIAAHHDGEDWTEEELDEIEQFKKFVKMKRNQQE